MKTLVCIFCLFVFSTTSFSQYEQLKATAETMASTFIVEGDKSTGTCFMIIKDGMQYFVTAAHLFNSSHKSGDLVPIRMAIQNQTESFNAHLYFHADRNVDIALFTLSEKVLQNLELPEVVIKSYQLSGKILQGNGISLDSIFITFGMEVFFYGFPLGNLGTEALGIKFPLVKKAIVSGWVKYKGLDVLVLDGRNNRGFSGGPVVAYDTSRKKMCIIGVVSGYVPEPADIQYKGDRLSFDENSGIIVSYERRYIEGIFSKNKKELR